MYYYRTIKSKGQNLVSWPWIEVFLSEHALSITLHWFYNTRLQKVMFLPTTIKRTIPSPVTFTVLVYSLAYRPGTVEYVLRQPDSRNTGRNPKFKRGSLQEPIVLID